MKVKKPTSNKYYTPIRTLIRCVGTKGIYKTPKSENKCKPR